MTKIHYSAASPGAGKTHYALNRMATTIGKYLYAVDRREVIDGLSLTGKVIGGSRLKALQDISAAAGKSPVIKSVQTPRETEIVESKNNVRAIVERAPSLYRDHEHVILVITHEAMKAANLEFFIGWELIIDETPVVFESQVAHTPATADFFEAQYKLERLTVDRSIVHLRHDAIGYSAIRGDDFLSGLANFHRRVAGKYSVVVDVESWDQLRTPKRYLTWWTLWLPNELTAFCKISVLANAFDRSVTAKIWQAIMPDLEFIPFTIPTHRQFKQRSMQINYFAQAHRAGSYFFQGSQGQDCLGKVNEWMAGNAPKDIIWTCNESIRPKFDITGISLTPKQAGSNAYQGHSAAAMFYTAKVSPVEMPILECLGVDARDIERSRELEDIYQFICRIAVRDPESTVPLQVFVYDAYQAAYLCDAFNALTYVDASVNLVEIGISDIVRASTGRKAIHSTNETPAEMRARKAAAKKRYRDVKRKNAIEAGTYTKPGRPRVMPSLH
jgi:hypothetical protein